MFWTFPTFLLKICSFGGPSNFSSRSSGLYFLKSHISESFNPSVRHLAFLPRIHLPYPNPPFPSRLWNPRSWFLQSCLLRTKDLILSHPSSITSSAVILHIPILSDSEPNHSSASPLFISFSLLSLLTLPPHSILMREKPKLQTNDKRWNQSTTHRVSFAYVPRLYLARLPNLPNLALNIDHHAMKLTSTLIFNPQSNLTI